MLIGLLAKTAILITEYAIERRRKGMGIVESAYSAAQVRLRPILMTVLTMIFGMLPLMFSSGAGANGNSSLGTGVVGGMQSERWLCSSWYLCSTSSLNTCRRKSANRWRKKQMYKCFWRKRKVKLNVNVNK